MAKITFDENNAVFALDIGTRTVIGLVVEPKGGQMKILAQAMVEHQSRAMLDGQIHDIPRVTEAVLKVKSALEKKLKAPLKKVAIAAAGRSLKTCRCRVDQELVEDLEIEAIMIHALELLGVQRAQELLAEEALPGDEEKFYCVGHSVVGYYLNDYPIANLEGHRGKKISAEVLATFLPASVVNSLYAVLARVGLEPLCLTLEPIAASEVVIPEQLRLLNLALVDVGAGTTDIAISRDGTITAYGMVPTAGDEITELIVENLMVDFMTAEQIKRSLGQGGNIQYQDVLGIKATVNCAEIIKMIEPAVENLAAEIAGHVLELNGQTPPKSVMCVGGGSQLPSLVEKIAHKLGLLPQRVVIRNRSHINCLSDTRSKDLTGPEGVTVAGIAALAAKKRGQNFITVTVNGRPFTLFNTGHLTVLQALSRLNFNPRELLGRHGKDLQFTLNGKPKTVYGQLAKPAAITVNGRPAHLKTLLQDGDVILVEKAINGRDATAKVGDFLEGAAAGHQQLCLLNGKPADPEQLIASGDVLEIAVLQANEHNREFSMPEVNREVLPAAESFAAGRRPAAAPADQVSITVLVNGRTVVMTGKKEYILIDIFNYYDLDPGQAKGKVSIMRNGHAAEYTELLQDGDVIEISW
ncbi:cell division FtsA domain-containing protein [Desulforamulus hydrothermalis]|uniref:Cell division protein FtsA n=1 Tax=Desulforamulus hydrothermalis Lam5 = DSM 18033 TaxID=1121428 RepID=K8EFG5_9FIRM|nr:cell division FtsA domain-containing protein [Desulforamulus hydrothermalis]CCO07416.1 Cell division protein FtsA [Desulforamulus hydrothermalis Lam5 = DSM 18033]SHH36201.1 cell division protein FtsA [Desulforamulus hydrothermalis Lam5 = DSM 18033]